jgi:hypothetical protein
VRLLYVFARRKNLREPEKGQATVSPSEAGQLKIVVFVISAARLLFLNLHHPLHGGGTIEFFFGRAQDCSVERRVVI